MLDMDQHTGMQVSWWEWNRWRFRVVSSASGGQIRDETKKRNKRSLCSHRLLPTPAPAGSQHGTSPDCAVCGQGLREVLLVSAMGRCTAGPLVEVAVESVEVAVVGAEHDGINRGLRRRPLSGRWRPTIHA